MTAQTTDLTVYLSLQNEKTKDRVTVLSHHTGHVNSVKWIHNHNGQTTELLSCSVDKTAVIWTLQNGNWNVTSILKGHTEGVTNIYGNYHGDRLTIYTASTDSTIKVWERIEGMLQIFFIIIDLFLFGMSTLSYS